MNKVITEEDIQRLREIVRDYLTEPRYIHTLAVEREAEKIGKIYLPEKLSELRCSALLHDITKKCDLEKQLQYCEEFDIIVDNYDILSPNTFHSMTAAGLAARDFPDFVTPDVLSGVRWHTTGHDNMTDFEAIVYLADYIEDTRTASECVELREYFYGGLNEGKNKREHFVSTMIMSFDTTIRCLIDEKAPIAPDTVTARSFYIKEKRRLSESV